MQDLISHPRIDAMYSYKLDIHDYFNSVNIDLLLPRLREILQGEEEVYDFLEGLLREPRALRELDHYIQQNIRYLTTGRHTKANYNLRYEAMQELGYRSLVGEYYRRKSIL